jgi:hypothetical protein
MNPTCPGSSACTSLGIATMLQGTLIAITFVQAKKKIENGFCIVHSPVYTAGLVVKHSAFLQVFVGEDVVALSP